MHVQRTTLRTKPHIKVFPFAQNRDQRYVAIYKEAIGYGGTPNIAFIHLMNDLLWKSQQFSSNN